MARLKEPSFFSQDANWARGIKWYANLFGGCPRGVQCGEASNSYSATDTYPDTVERIATTVPDVKIVYIVRHPVARTESDWMEAYRFNGVSFSDYLANDNIHRDKNNYIKHYWKYREQFGHGNVLVLTYEEMVVSPDEVISRCCEFLGVRYIHGLASNKLGRPSGKAVALPAPVRRLKNSRIYVDFSHWIPKWLKKVFIANMTEVEIPRPKWQPHEYHRFRNDFETQSRRLLVELGKSTELWKW